jgi:hypothetical protein
MKTIPGPGVVDVVGCKSFHRNMGCHPSKAKQEWVIQPNPRRLGHAAIRGGKKRPDASEYLFLVSLIRRAEAGSANDPC